MALPPLPTPTATQTATAKSDIGTGQREDVESIVRAYCRLASKGKIAEIEQIIQIIPPKQPVLTEEERKGGATVPNFGLIGDLEKVDLLEDTPRWIAFGSKSVVELSVEFETFTSARVHTLLRSRELPGVAGNFVFKLSNTGSGWKINSVSSESADDGSMHPRKSNEI